MATKREEESLDIVAGKIATSLPGSTQHTEFSAELQRRQMLAMLEATKAQTAAAKAGQEAAEAATLASKLTAKNVRLMLWSVIVASASTVITATGVAYSLFGRQ